MATDELAPRSRRALLTAAAGAAGALAAGALIPANVAAIDPNDVAMNQDNATTAPTSVSNSAATAEPSATDSPAGTAFAGHATGSGTGYGLHGTSKGDGTNVNPGGAGVIGWSTSAPAWTPSFTSTDTALTGVFGYAPAGNNTTNSGTGVWGDSPDVGVFGTGGTGVEGFGDWGVFGAAFGSVGVRGETYKTSAPTAIAVQAVAALTTQTALSVSGKAHFSRSGRSAIAAGKSSLKVTLAGTTASSKVFAVLATSATGRFVRAVVPASGSFTVYLNTTVAAKSYLSWFVLD